MKKIIKEAIVVEGKDDTAAINNAVTAKTIETHGFGMPDSIWPVIDKAYRECGIIVFTDPDFAGDKIRRKVTERYPDAKQAFLPKDKALKKGDIGVENAKPEDILEALMNCHCTSCRAYQEFTMDDMISYRLTGASDSKERREKLGALLSIGYGNTKTFLKKLNMFGITREEFNKGVEKI